MMLLANLNQLSFNKKVLSQALLVLFTVNMPVYAMQVLDDDSMADVTGEGIGFTVDTANIQFNSADDTGAAGDANAGYVRLIPRGALSTTVIDHNTAVAAGCGAAVPPGGCTAAQIATASKYNVQIGKGDIYLYGFSLSANDNSANIPRNTGDFNIGTSANPMVLKVVTQPAVPNFVGATTENISYMAFEFPLYQASWSGLTFTDLTPKNLKLGMWTDAFVRNANVAEGAVNQFWLNSPATGNRNTSLTDTTQIPRENRLRLQTILNGFSLDGSNVKIFQTQTGATNANGLSTAYNDTFGLAAVMRINTGDSRNLKATLADNTTGVIGAVPASFTTIHGGGNTTLDSSTTNPANGTGNCNNGGGGSEFNEGSVGCRYLIQNKSRTDTKTRTRSWTVPAVASLNGKVLRLSTRQTAPSGVLTTPALNGIAAPTFASNEGLHMYNPNINLVVGSIWQPVILGVAPDNKNLFMEVTRIPNKPEIYKEVYTAYSGAQGSMSNADFAGLNGSTCNIYQCGGTTTTGGYQTSNNAYFYENNNGTVTKLTAKNATHSSITVGTVNYDRTNNLLTAYNGEDAIGVSFGALTTNTLSASTSATSHQVRYQRREEYDSTWIQRYECTTFGGCNTLTTGHVYQWRYYNTASTTVNFIATGVPGNANCTGDFFGNCGPVTSGSTPIFGSTANRSWTGSTVPGGWLTGVVGADETAFNNFIGAGNGTMASVAFSGANQAANPIVGTPVPLNNFGSAAIDGLLIQHLKITTKGL